MLQDFLQKMQENKTSSRMPKALNIFKSHPDEELRLTDAVKVQPSYHYHLRQQIQMLIAAIRAVTTMDMVQIMFKLNQNRNHQMMQRRL